MKFNPSEKKLIFVFMDMNVIHWVAGNIDAEVIFIDENLDGLDDEEICELDEEEVYMMRRPVDTNIEKSTIKKIYKMVKSKEKELGIERGIG